MDTRRTFTREFKLAAVKKITEQGLSYSQVAKDLDVRESMVRRWKKVFEENGTLQAQTTSTNSTEDELKRLREENRQLKMERDILKKATAFFAKENG